MSRKRLQLDRAPPRSTDQIVADAALIARGSRLVRVPIDYPDPQRPWLKPRSAPMMWIRGAGLLAMLPSNRRRLVGVVLFDTTSAPPEIIKRQLVYTHSQTTAVWFRDELGALRDVLDIVENCGGLRPGFSWYPDAQFGTFQ